MAKKIVFTIDPRYGVDSYYTLKKLVDDINDAIESVTPGGSVTYSGEAERTVGGIAEGMIFNEANMTTMWDQLIKQEKFPVLTPPYSTFTLTITGLREINEIINITVNSTFNRGSINPQYTSASPYRSGLPNQYQYIGTGLSNQSKADLTDSQVINNYQVLAGVQTWQGRVAYDAGVQPKTSYGNDYDSPLPAGFTSYISRTITGVYPYFGTTIDITTRTKQPLASHSAAYWQIDMVAESGGNKQTAWFPNAFSTITGIQFYNTISGTWDWISGSKPNSLLTFTVTTTQIDINGINVDYNVYTHNGLTIGSRQLRFYTT